MLSISRSRPTRIVRRPKGGNRECPTRSAPGGPVQPAVRRRRGLPITLLPLAAFVVLVGAVAGGGFLFVNHVTGSIQRIQVRFTRLDAASKPAGEYDSYGGAMTVLITGEASGRPATTSSTSGSTTSTGRPLSTTRASRT